MQSWNLPKIRTTLSKKHGQLNSLYNTLLIKSNEPIEWGYSGLRIEVRVNAPTLSQAKECTNTWEYFSWDNLQSIKFLKVLLYYLYNLFTNLNLGF
jgi:hypothetical protein